MPSRDMTPNHIQFSKRKPKTFSLPCVRRLYQYLGEYDALVELTELAARTFIHDAHSSGDVGGFVTRRSDEHKVKVHASEFSQFSVHLARSYIITVAAAAETFLQEHRREHVQLFGKEWVGDSKDATRLDVALKNVAGSEKAAVSEIGEDLITRFHYYRVVRNWVCHEKDDSDISKPLKRYQELVATSEENSDLTTLSAPNAPDKLTFDDFVLFTRVVKKIADRLNELATPNCQILIDGFSMAKFKPLLTKRERLRNSIDGQLRNEYALDSETSWEITDEILGSLA